MAFLIKKFHFIHGPTLKCNVGTYNVSNAVIIIIINSILTSQPLVHRHGSRGGRRGRGCLFWDSFSAKHPKFSRLASLAGYLSPFFLPSFLVAILQSDSG